MKVGYQGIDGAYSQIASKSFFKEPIYRFVGYESFDAIFADLRSDKLDYGVVPIENSLAGSIHKNIDLLNKSDLKIIGEVYLRINHNLLGISGAKMGDIKEVYSHWQALAQCEESIKTNLPGVKIREYFDTAGSAKFIKDEGDKGKAAIASSLAGELYGLEILKDEFEDNKNNFTRFVVINKNYQKLDQENKNYKTSIIFSGKNIPGFLYSVLKSFAVRNIDLSKIESRPIPEDAWNYFFYIDFKGRFDDKDCAEALAEIKNLTTDFKILGSYISEH